MSCAEIPAGRMRLLFIHYLSVFIDILIMNGLFNNPESDNGDFF